MFGKTKASSAGSVPKTRATQPNPYVANLASDDDRYMNLTVSRQNWIRAFQIMAALLAVSIGFNGYYMTQSKFIPVYIAYDKIGNVVTVGAVDKANPIDSKRVIRKSIENWIVNARVISGDQLAQKKFINSVYARVTSTGKAKKMLDEYYRSRNIWETASKFSVTAEVTLLLPAAGNTYQVEWTEVTRSMAGDIVKTERWKALLSYEIMALSSEEAINVNPEGLFITDFSWSKQI